MQNKIITNTISTLKIIAISSLTIFTLYTVQAWVGPTLSAPNGNVGGPLTTATSTQIKTGSLGVLDNFSIGNTLIVNGGFRFATTSAGAGKVLTSDAQGNASWASSTGSGCSESVGVWQDVTASRKWDGTVYKNTTGSSIEVSVTTQWSTGPGGVYVTVNNVKIAEQSMGNYVSKFTETFIVPTNGTYSITTSGPVYSGGLKWSEFIGGLGCNAGPVTIGGGLGYGQTWQRPVRSLAAVAPTSDCFGYMGGPNVYTNDTGKPIFVSISMSGGGNSGGVIFVDGLERGRFYASAVNANGQLTTIVPNGSTYSAQPSCWGGALVQWSELR